MSVLQLRCPRCGHVIVRFDEAELEQNKAKKRSHDHFLKNPVLCQGCNQLVRKLVEERVEL
ncbi:MAG TPA: hypothetical protein VGK74_03900 [Symbiobacteriaceae bacterium]|jgi:uncharacterized protein with PIN domain